MQYSLAHDRMREKCAEYAVDLSEYRKRVELINEPSIIQVNRLLKATNGNFSELRDVVKYKSKDEIESVVRYLFEALVKVRPESTIKDVCMHYRDDVPDSRIERKAFHIAWKDSYEKMISLK